MKCQVTFMLAKDFFFEPSDVNIETYYVHGKSIEDCQHIAWSKIKSDYSKLTVQEILIRKVK